jgi:hypothetical protein
MRPIGTEHVDLLLDSSVHIRRKVAQATTEIHIFTLSPADSPPPPPPPPGPSFCQLVHTHSHTVKTKTLSQSTVWMGESRGILCVTEHQYITVQYRTDQNFITILRRWGRYGTRVEMKTFVCAFSRNRFRIFAKIACKIFENDETLSENYETLTFR